MLQPYGRMSDDEGNEMLIFYSLGNFVSTQEGLSNLLGGMASFTIQKSVLKGKTEIQILDPVIKPTVMHYNKDEEIFGPYMLEDYTEELASQHGVRNIIGDEFSLENLRKKFNEIMSMNVEPSTRTDLLDVSFDYEMNMTDSRGNYVEDIWSVSADQYLEEKASSSSNDSSDGSEGYENSEGSEESGNYDDSGEYDDSEEDYSSEEDY